MSDDTADPAWTPSVSVVGLGDAGTETVDAVTTPTATTFATVDGPDDAAAVAASVAADDFCYLTGDVSDPAVVDAAETILDATEGHTSFFLEGTTDRPEPIVEGCDFLLPIDPDAAPPPDGRALVASAIVDCAEAMLRPTGQDLGYGDILLATRSGRIGSLRVAAIGGLQHPLTDRVDVTDPDGVLHFLCGDETLSHTFADVRGSRRSREYPDANEFLWDRRIHDRYGDPAHVKTITTVAADADRRERLLRS
ncbi:hypothetical protein [Haloplanus salilacus]|uniref:hypothetical protein n=1 Tax=Haloplanus salilacus TaxID=2949994 RepID=UPI0030D18DC6